MRKAAILSALLFTLAFPLAAQTNDLGLWYSHATVDSTSDDDASVEFDDGTGFGISFNHHFTPALSTEFAAMRVSHDGAVVIPDFAFDLGELEMTAITAVVQWHLGSGRIRPYIGGGASYITIDNLSGLADLGTGEIEVDDGFSWVANGGVSFNLTPRLALGLDAKYIPYAPESFAAGDDEGVELELNPVIISAGVRIRF